METGQIQFSDFNPIHSGSSRIYQERETKLELEKHESVKSWEDLTDNLSENVAVYNYQFDKELYIPVRLTTEVANETVVTVNTDVIDNGSYFIIGGCFSVENNAENLVSDLVAEGFAARILDQKNGLHRVTIGSFNSKDEAEKSLNNFRNQGHSGWILSK